MVAMPWIALFVAHKEQQKHPMVVAMAHLLPSFCHPVLWDHFAVASLYLLCLISLLRKFMGLPALLLKMIRWGTQFENNYLGASLLSQPLSSMLEEPQKPKQLKWVSKKISPCT
jgi:hypothetical protein